MDLKILKFLVTLLIISRLTHQITTPEDRCAISESGFVCLDCFSRGACFLNEEDGTYAVIFDNMCPSTPSQIYCDDTILDPQNFGSCSILATDTNCSCSSSTKCIADVNNPSVLIQCEDDFPISDPPCSFPLLDLNSCSCASFAVGDCMFLDDPTDDCANFFLDNGDNTLTPFTCKNGTCFDPTACGCVIPPLKCPSDCPLVDDPNDDCGRFFLCSGNDLVPGNCTGTLCFDQASCLCVDSEGSSTTTTEPLTCPSGCPFVDDPTRCQSYFICSGTDLIPFNCTGTFCFDQASCGCIESEGSSSTTEPRTCPSDCPFLDDKTSCQSYFVCDSGGSLTQINCTGSLCFDQASCGCIENTSSSTTTTIPPTPTTCPAGCPFVDDPYDNCTKFYICNEGSLVSHECPGSGALCFNQEECQCQ